MKVTKKIIPFDKIVDIIKDNAKDLGLSLETLDNIEYHRLVELLIFSYMLHIRHKPLLFRSKTFVKRASAGLENVFVFNQNNDSTNEIKLRLSLFEVKSKKPINCQNGNKIQFIVDPTFIPDKSKIKIALNDVLSRKSNSLREEQIENISDKIYGFEVNPSEKTEITTQLKDNLLTFFKTKNNHFIGSTDEIYNDFLYLKNYRSLPNIFLGTATSNIQLERIEESDVINSMNTHQYKAEIENVQAIICETPPNYKKISERIKGVIK